MTKFIYPPKLVKGDKVAILSPSSGLPEIFSEVYELGLERLKNNFGLIPVEYPTTRKMNSSLKDRARDLHSAISDPEIKGIICSIGGDDQIRLIKYLNKDLIENNPKMFMGYSDNTHIQLFLWNLGIVSYYGGGIMTQFGMNGSMHDYTTNSLNTVLFESGEKEITASTEFTDEGLDWRDPNLLKQNRKMFQNDGWSWINDGKVVEGITWGGCLESLDFQLRADRYLPDIDSLKNKILFFETSEEIPNADYVYRVLMGMGERGMLEQFSAVLVGRPKAWEFDNQKTQAEKIKYKAAQKEAIMKAMSEYNRNATIIFNLDIGHTDPQFILPNGGNIKIDGISKKILIKY